MKNNKIAILTFHTAFNYGAMLQAYALQTKLISLGFDVKIIDFYPKHIEKQNHFYPNSLSIKNIAIFLYSLLNLDIRRKLKRFNNFRTKMLLTNRFYFKYEVQESQFNFDAYIVGSDQVWNMEKEFDSFWFLDFVKKAKKISYAASFGTSCVNAKYYSKIKEYTRDFSAISVRELDGVKIIKDATRKDVKLVLDPTLLMNENEWNSLISKKNMVKDYILLYTFTNNKKIYELIHSVKKRFDLPVYALSAYAHFPFKVDKVINDAGPKEFLALIKNATVVCTDSFHGTAFSINFRKTFFSFPHETRNSRIDSLLNILGLKNRQFYKVSDICGLDEEELVIDYKNIDAKINLLVEKSLAYLLDNLK